jgi:hypothetical protein
MLHCMSVEGEDDTENGCGFVGNGGPVLVEEL